MKKKILFSLLMILVFFLVTACDKVNHKEGKEKTSSLNYVTIQGKKFKLVQSANLYDMQYHENYVDFHTEAVGDYRVMSYVVKEQLIFEIRLMSEKNRSLSELKAILDTQKNAKESVKKVNGVLYIYYEYLAEDGTPVHHYLYGYNERAYSIGFFLGKDAGNIEEVFMSHVSFQ